MMAQVAVLASRLLRHKIFMLTYEVNKQVDIVLPKKRLEEVVAVFAQVYKFKKKRHFSLAFVDNKTIKRLNNNYRGISKVTDVLSFAEDFKNFVDVPADRRYLGEIVICVPQAKKQARQLGYLLSQEITRLLVHGLTHLVGYNHEGVSKEEENKMFDFEAKVMAKIKP